MTDRDLMRPEELAAEWGTAVKTLANQRSKREGPPYIRLSGGAIRYSRKAVAAWLDQRTVSPGSGAA